MTDLASIGFRADTRDLEKSVVNLTKLKTAASGVTPAANNIAKALEGVSRSFLGAAAGMTKAIAALVSATQGASKAQIKAAKDAATFTQNIYDAALAQEKLAVSITKTNTALQKQIDYTTRNRINQMTGVTNLSGKSAADSASVFEQAAQPAPIARDQMPNRFNTANLAAQFQDIGVTAQMGMSPLLVAVQQGTQLSAILNTMERPLQGIAQAFMQIINPVTLMTIALTGLAVVLLQAVDWAEVGKTTLYGLADAIELIGPYALGAAAALTVLYTPAIIGGIINLTKVIYGVTTSLLAFLAANPAVWVAAAVAAFGAFVVYLTQVSQSFRKFVNTVIGLFVGLFNSVVSLFSKDLLGKLFGDMLITGINTTIYYGKVFVNKMIDLVNSLITAIPEQFRGGLQTIGHLDLGDTLANPFEGGMEQAGAIITKEMDKALNNVDYVGIIGKNVDKGIKWVTGKLRGLADGIGQADDKKKTKAKKDPWKEIIDGADRRIESLKAEQAAIGETAFETERLKYETDLLNQAQQKGLELDSAQIAILQDKAVQMATLSENIRILKDRLEFAKSATKGFVDDMKTGLQQGISVWEAFGNAVMNVLDKILDRFIDQGIDALFNGLKASSESGDGGFLNQIGGWLFSAGASGASAPAASPTMAAKGGTFSNGIYNSPTMFAFASGGQFGVMGEAGPEAVMPLHRGPDGSLGVAVNGDPGAGAKPSVNVEVVVNGNATVEQENQTMSDGTEMRRFIINVVNEANANGQFDSSNAGRYGTVPRRVAR